MYPWLSGKWVIGSFQGSWLDYFIAFSFIMDTLYVGMRDILHWQKKNCFRDSKGIDISLGFY